MTVYKKELINAVQEKLGEGYTKDETDFIIKAVFESITEFNEDAQAVQVVGFGTFDTREVKGTTGISKLHKDADGVVIEKPWTSETHRVPCFRAGVVLKDSVR